MSLDDLPKDFLRQCKAVTKKRPRTVIDHILKNGFVTTQELRDVYGYNHPPRAARDVREEGIPLETFRVEGPDGRKIGAYRFGDPRKARFSRLSGRTAFSKALKRRLVEKYGSKCVIYLEMFPEAELEIDHRIPFEVIGDDAENMDDPDAYMLLSASANRAKSWACEHCENWQELKESDICRRCYWAFPEEYDHVAMREVRRVDILWSGGDVAVYDKLKEKTLESQKELPEYVKRLIERHLKE